jgi:hypothetical protein
LQSVKGTELSAGFNTFLSSSILSVPFAPFRTLSHPFAPFRTEGCNGASSWIGYLMMRPFFGRSLTRRSLSGRTGLGIAKPSSWDRLQRELSNRNLSCSDLFRRSFRLRMEAVEKAQSSPTEIEFPLRRPSKAVHSRTVLAGKGPLTPRRRAPLPAPRRSAREIRDGWLRGRPLMEDGFIGPF